MKKQQGFTIIMAIFILVVLGLLGGYMVKLSGVQQATSVYALQGARAYQAAKAGIGWAKARIHSGGDCDDITAGSPLSFAGLSGFSVVLDCTYSSPISEDTANLVFYKITTLSEFGDYNSANYVSRNLEISFVK